MAEEQVVLTLEKAVAGGRTLARLDGRIVLVGGGIPGERVRVEMERAGKGVAFARVIAVEEASPDRVVPAIDVQCGGLVFGHVAYPRQLELKRAIVEDAMQRIGRLREVPPIATVGSPSREWRLRARLHVASQRVGFYREGTHTLCDAAPSGQLASGLLDLAQRIVASLRPEVARNVEAIVVTETVRGDARAVHLELSRPLPRHVAIDAAGGTGVSAALVASRHPTTVAGHPWVRESLEALGVGGAGEAGLMRHASAFFQGNRLLIAPLVSHVLDALDPSRPVVDLYAGVGLFGVAAAVARDQSVVCVEGDAVSAEDLVTNAAPFGARVRAVRSDVETFLRREAEVLEDACVIVDPPRTGLLPVVSGAIAAARPSRVVYVSCDPATLARDLRALTGAGFEVGAMTVFDMFPMTAHVETVVALQRVG